jgi:hypothetical protein
MNDGLDLDLQEAIMIKRRAILWRLLSHPFPAVIHSNESEIGSP